MIALPPFEAGADQETVAEVLPGEAVTPVGLPGIVRGVTAGDTAEAGPSPFTLCPTTVNVYAVPLASPLTVQLKPLVVQWNPPGAEVTT
jgi:hypothetical protein